MWKQVNWNSFMHHFGHYHIVTPAGSEAMAQHHLTNIIIGRMWIWIWDSESMNENETDIGCTEQPKCIMWTMARLKHAKNESVWCTADFGDLWQFDVVFDIYFFFPWYDPSDVWWEANTIQIHSKWKWWWEPRKLIWNDFLFPLHFQIQ